MQSLALDREGSRGRFEALRGWSGPIFPSAFPRPLYLPAPSGNQRRTHEKRTLEPFPESRDTERGDGKGIPSAAPSTSRPSSHTFCVRTGSFQRAWIGASPLLIERFAFCRCQLK